MKTLRIIECVECEKGTIKENTDDSTCGYCGSKDTWELKPSNN